jgi:hypothetical protein
MNDLTELPDDAYDRLVDAYAWETDDVASFLYGAAVAFGLMGMAEAIRNRPPRWVWRAEDEDRWIAFSSRKSDADRFLVVWNSFSGVWHWEVWTEGEDDTDIVGTADSYEEATTAAEARAE